MATYAELWNELVGHIPSLSPFLAQRFVQRAWRDIRQRGSWSFLLGEGFLIVPAKISTGTVTTTQYSKNVTPNAAAITALNAAGSHPLIGDRQFRLSAGSRIYNVDTWDGTTLVLKEEYQETGAAGSAYEVLSVYFKAPTTDFVRFISIRDLSTNYYIKINYAQEELNRLDPQRATSGDPLYCASYKTDSTGLPWFELWPTPSVQRSYQILYQRRGNDFATSTETQPGVIPDSLIIDLALYYAYRWAETAKGSHKELSGTDWRYSAAEAKANFDRQLTQTKREDDEIFLQSIKFAQGRQGFISPIDANYAQNHPVSNWGDPLF
jgi:hypothetical protein